jgi:hypothetical protein
MLMCLRSQVQNTNYGYSDSIPEPIRRAVIARDKHCAWPGGCDKRPAGRDVHHIRHKKDGGPNPEVAA